MNLSDILFIMWLNTVPIGLLGMGSYIFYLFVIYEHNRLNKKERKMEE